MTTSNDWRIKPIKEFTQVITGGTPSTMNKEYWENGTVPWLPSGDLKDCRITKAHKFITKKGLDNSAAKMMPIGTVLIALTGATTGQTGLLDIESTANQSVTGILPSDEHIPEYLFYYLQTLRGKIIKQSYGGAQKHISQEFVKNIQITLPPLGTQKQIVKILEKAEDLIKLRTMSTNLTKNLQAALFHEMFGNPKNNPNRLKSGKIRDLVLEANYGIGKKGTEDKGNYPLLRMNNITYTGEWDLTSLQYVDLTPDEVKRYTVKEGELLFNRTNSKELVGKCAVFRGKQPMAFAGYLVKLKTANKATSEYIAAYLNSSYGKAQLLNRAKNIVGMANINAQEVQEIPILIPDNDAVLIKFADSVKSLENLKRLQKESKNEIDNLFSSLLNRMLKGEIVC